MQYKCKNCGEGGTKDIKATGLHTIVNRYFAPTCEQKGGHYDICTVCNKYGSTLISGTDLYGKLVGSGEEKLGHAYEEYISKNATCKEAGEKRKKCSRCGKDIKVSTISKTSDHAYVETVTKQATCTAKGAVYQVCVLCGKTGSKVRDINAYGHSYSNWYVSSKTINGKKLTIKETRKCNRCGALQNATGSVTFPKEHAVGKYYYKLTASSGKIEVNCISCKKKATGTISGTSIKFGSVGKGTSSTKGWKK